MLKVMEAEGAVDGATKKQGHTVDGMSLERQIQVARGNLCRHLRIAVFLRSRSVEAVKSPFDDGNESQGEGRSRSGLYKIGD